MKLTLNSKMLSIVLLGSALWMFNILIREYDYQADFTEEQLYTVSEGSQGIFTNMQANVVVRYYRTQDSSRFPPHLSDYAGRVEALLKELRDVSDGRMKLEIYDPEPDSELEDRAEQDGLVAQSFDDGQIYFGLSFSCIDQQREIPFLFPEREPALEYEIMKRIAEVSAVSRPRVGLLATQPLSGGEAELPSGELSRFPSWFVLGELEKIYDIVHLTVDDNLKEKQLDALVLIHPANANEAFQAKLEAFLVEGGKALIMLDSAALIPKLLRAKTLPDRSSNLALLLDAWGVTFSSTEIVTDWRYKTDMGSYDGELESLGVLTLDQEALNGSVSWLSAIDRISLAYSGEFEQRAPLPKGLALTPAIWSSDYSSQTDSKAFVPLDVTFNRNLRDTFTPSGRKKLLAFSVSGVFPNTLTESDLQAKPGQAILFGDSDFIYDAFSVVEKDRLGEKEYVPINGNISIFISALASLTGSDYLSQVRNREGIRRGFSRIEEIESRASAKFEQKLRKVEAALREVNGRLEDFNRQAAAQGRPSAALQAQIHAEKKNRRELLAQLKAVRLEFRREIYHLENMIKWLNIALVPVLLVIVGGLYAAFRRRRRVWAQ